MKCSILIILLTLSSSLFARDLEKKVAIFVLDGVRFDVFDKVLKNKDASFFKEIIENGAVRTGHMGSAGINATSSYGWSTLVSFTNDHGVYERNNTFNGKRIKDRPNFFKVAYDQKPDIKAAAFVNWEPLITNIFAPNNKESMFVAESFGHLETTPYSFAGDKAVTSRTIDYIDKKGAPNILFVGFDGTDEIGHLDGYSPKVKSYVDAVDLLLELSEDVVQKIKGSPNYKNEEWLFIITTDHAGNLATKHHFEPRTTEFTRRTFVATMSPNKKINLPKTVNSADLSAIVFNYLDLDVPKYYKGDFHRRQIFLPKYKDDFQMRVRLEIPSCSKLLYKLLL